MPVGGSCEFLLEHSAGLKTHTEAGRHLDALERGGILANPRRPVMGFKYAKVAEFKAVAILEFADDFIQKRLDRSPSNLPTDLVLASNTVHQFFFCYGRHASPFFLTWKSLASAPSAGEFKL
jgi:hypothetical protein